MSSKKQYTGDFKARVALDAIKSQKTIGEIASHYSIHPFSRWSAERHQIHKWKKHVLDELPKMFTDNGKKIQQDNEKLQSKLYEQIGKLKVELDWLKKKLACSVDQKRHLVDLSHPDIPIYRQCELLGLSRSSFYYEPVGISEYNHLLMGMIDREYTKHPFYGILRMTARLGEEGHQVNHKRVGRLMQLMGIRAIYPKPRLSKGVDTPEQYPYLLRGLVIQRPNHVWGTDITYIKLRQGFIYLVAVMDWFSRYVLSWELSNSLDSFFCMSVLERALDKGTPEIFNNDQGVQFTSESFTGRLKEEGIRISWDGRGRFWDNIFIERLWRSVKAVATRRCILKIMPMFQKQLTNWVNTSISITPSDPIRL